jgi:hypothetical protein
MWTKRGPDTPRLWGQRRSASRTLPGKADPRRLPRQANPPGNRLARGSPGGVWARDIPLYRRAIPGQRHGGTPTPYLFKPQPQQWLYWTVTRWPEHQGRSPLASSSWYAAARVGFEPSAALPQRPRCWVCSAGKLRSFLPLRTAGAHHDPGVTNAVRTQHGPEAGCLRRRAGRLLGQWAPLVLSCSEPGSTESEFLAGWSVAERAGRGLIVR